MDRSAADLPEFTLFDTSWTLHRITQLDLPGQDLSDLVKFGRAAHDFNVLLRQTSKGGIDYDEEDSDHTGGFRDVMWKIIHTKTPKGHMKPRGLLISIEYDKATYKAIFLQKKANITPIAQISPSSPRLPLLLTRMPPSLLKRFLKYLTTSDFINATIQPFRLSTSNLCSILSDYIYQLSDLSNIQTQDSPSIDPKDFAQSLSQRTIRDLRLTLAFSAPIAPQLRSLDVEIPFETLWRLVRPNTTPEDAGGTFNNGGRSTIETTSPTTDEQGFLDRLAEHINKTTGMNLPLRQTHPDSNAGSSATTGINIRTADAMDLDASIDESIDSIAALDSTPSSTANGVRPAPSVLGSSNDSSNLIRLSRLACTSLVVSGDGKLKIVSGHFAGSSVDEVEEEEEVDNDDGEGGSNDKNGKRNNNTDERSRALRKWKDTNWLILDMLVAWAATGS